MPIAITIPGAAYPIFAIFNIKESEPLNNLFENAKKRAITTISRAPKNPNFRVLKSEINTSELLEPTELNTLVINQQIGIKKEIKSKVSKKIKGLYLLC